jgi:hypothetical protein
MATLNFPTDPEVGDTYKIGSTTYQWNGSAWIIQSQSNVSVTNLTVETIYVTSTTNYSSSTFELTGALVVEGGAAIGRDLYVGGTLYTNGAPVLTTSSFGITAQDGIDIDIVESTSTGILVWNNISTLQSVTGRGSSTNHVITFSNQTESTSTMTGGIVILGGVGVGKRVTCESLRIADSIFDSTRTLVNTTATTAIDTYSTTQFRSAKYLVQIDEGIGTFADFELREILLVADNNNHVWATEYGVVTSNGDLGVFAADIIGTTVTLYFTAYSATSKTIKVLRTGMAV